MEYISQISPSHFKFTFFDHYSFWNSKNHYYPLFQLKTISEIMVPAYRIDRCNVEFRCQIHSKKRHCDRKRMV